jgi:hypothetical protein
VVVVLHGKKNVPPHHRLAKLTFGGRLNVLFGALFGAINLT